MKPIIYFISAALVLLTGCNKSETAPSQEQYDRYIFFSQGVDTKASLINGAADMAGKEFAVIGFGYDKSKEWEVCKATAVPNVFYDDAGNGPIPVETLTCDEGSVSGNPETIAASYTPLQGWSNTKKYAFFAYYPNSLDNSYVSLVNLNGTGAYTPGAPSIKYTMDTDSPADFKASMVDLMTATPHKDLDGSSSSVTSQDVLFNFSHRLSCLGLKIKNSSISTITITRVTLSVSDILYQTAVFPLDGSASSPSGNSISAEFNLGVADGVIPNGTPSNYVELSDKLIFIPQSEEISITITIDYKRAEKDGYAEVGVSGFELPAVQTNLIEGMKHLIYLNFTESTVEVDAEINNSAWTEMPTVNNTFN